MFFSDVKEVVELIDVVNFKDLADILDILFEIFGLKKYADMFSLEFLVSSEFLHCKPETSHFSNEKAWHIYKVELCRSILTHLIKVMPKKEDKHLIWLMTMESEHCFATDRKISDSDVIKEILKSNQDNIQVYLFYSHILTIRGGVTQSLKLLGNML